LAQKVHSFDRIATRVYALAAMSRTSQEHRQLLQAPAKRAFVRCAAPAFALLLALPGCVGENNAGEEPATVLARHIDQLLDDPSGLPRATTPGELAADVTAAAMPNAVTPMMAGLEADATTTVDVQSAPDVQAPATVPAIADAAVAQAPDVQIAPDVVPQPDAKAKGDATLMPIVPIPVHRDGTPIALPSGELKPDAKLGARTTGKQLPIVVPTPIVAPTPIVVTTPIAKTAPIVKAAPIVKLEPREKPVPIAKPQLSAAERKAQAKVAAIAAKADAKAAAKKAAAEKKKKALAAVHEKQKRAAAAKQKKLDAKKAAVLVRKAAAWAKKHPKGVNPYAAKLAAIKQPTPKPDAGKPSKPETLKPETLKPETLKPPKPGPGKPETPKPEAVKPVKAEVRPTLAPTKGEPEGDATELFFSGKRKQDAGDFHGAIDDFKASQQARPSPRTLTALGRAYFDAGEMNAAANVLRQAGHHEDAQLLLGTLYQQTDKPDKARKVYEDFLKEHPDHAKADWVRRLLKTL
jgi:tetratricopeptide (TPR) repeat protein